jgi:hypothetical protein
MKKYQAELIQGAVARDDRVLKLIQDAVAREGHLDENGRVVVPEDFFDRLVQQLNARPSETKDILDILLEKIRHGRFT